MKNIINIVGVNVVAGTSKKTGNHYDMRMAQCVVELVNPDTGEAAPLIGELVLPEKFKDTKPGRYEVDFEISVNRDRRIEARVSAMSPVGSRSAAAPGKVA